MLPENIIDISRLRSEKKTVLVAIGDSANQISI